MKATRLDGSLMKDKLQTRLMFMKHYAPNRCLCINVANGGHRVGGGQSGWM